MPKYRIEITPYGERRVQVLPDPGGATLGASGLIENAGVPRRAEHLPQHHQQAERLVGADPGVPGHMSVGARQRVPLGDFGRPRQVDDRARADTPYRPGAPDYDADMTAVLSDLARLKGRVGELERRLEVVESYRPSSSEEDRPAPATVEDTRDGIDEWAVAPAARTDHAFASRYETPPGEPSWFDRPVTDADADDAEEEDSSSPAAEPSVPEEPTVRPPVL